MSVLLERIYQHIDDEGGISVADYMLHALADPEYGYYTTGTPLGLEGDFVTAPEISQVFGEMLGVWLAECWRLLGKPEADLVELGPGLGTLMHDVLRATRHVEGFHAALRVQMVETSPRLREHQQYVLRAKHAETSWPDISWHERLPQSDRPLLVFGNEFFDALPVYQYIATAKGFRERIVVRAEQGDGLAFDIADHEYRRFPHDYPRIPAGVLEEGAVVEVCPLAQEIMRDIAARISRQGGAALFVDYGYTRPETASEQAQGDTLQSVRKHRYHDVLEAPGTADITTHVDFTALAQVAVAAGAYAPPVLGQGEFLLAMGGQARADRLCAVAHDTQVQQNIANGFYRLVAPQEMGELFKVMAIVPAGIPAPVFTSPHSTTPTKPEERA